MFRQVLFGVYACLILQWYAAICAAQPVSPPAAIDEVVYTRTEYHLPNGKVVVVEDGTRPAAPMKAAPAKSLYEVQAPVPRAASAPVAPVYIFWPDGRRTLGTFGEYLAAGGDPANIRTPTGAPVPAAYPVAVQMPAQGVPAPVPFVVSPAATTITVTGAAPSSAWSSGYYPTAPIRTAARAAGTRGGISAGFNVRGPFGGSFAAGVGACGPGG